MAVDEGVVDSPVNLSVPKTLKSPSPMWPRTVLQVLSPKQQSSTPTKRALYNNVEDMPSPPPAKMPRLRSTTTGSRARKSADSHSKPSSTRHHSLPESSIGDRRRQKLQRLLDSPMMQVEGMSWTRQRQREFVKSRIEAYGGTP
ncbi:hypothetical protein KC19_VG232200 [Ceratodon purpureus]|uniref:Uncharacterized protein n=1 Tax=Ceratodon purpureus TaxID=3225 RepID=A0A8T0HTF7_CERPU|nr:hypothetical protein KC19_VG232200 [Ceratodon purpureus]